ncbi:MAG: T9SS type A sorting domain-containing protein [Bacteroidetes bacterium]|nr:T9SS type A sorting domain-containing protein [Bacteroidota bacterium]
MTKKLLTIASIALTVTASAQVGGRTNNVLNMEPVSEISKSITYKAASAPAGCDTITSAQNGSLTVNTAGSDTSTPGCAPKAGYVFGSNCYQDKEKANFFPVSLYSSVAQGTVTGVIVSFFKNLTRGTGGAATTTVGMTLYNGSLAGGPTTVLTQTTATMAQILAAQVGTNTSINYLFVLPANVVAPTTGGFFASVVIPTISATGDTAVVFNSPASLIDYGYEKWSDNTWHSISSAWGASLKGNLSIYPVMCGNLVVTGISKNLGLSKDVTIMPNPSTGLVNVAIALPNSQDLSLTVTNALGQVIVSNKYNSVITENVSLDLTNQSNGVYFVTISNGTDKMVQRLILAK